MGCTRDHPDDPRERVVPGLYRCLSTVMIPAPTAYPDQSVMTPVPHGELYYDAAAEPIATCGCGKYAVTICRQCHQYRCLTCLPVGRPACVACTPAAAEVPDDRQRQLDAVARTPDPYERLLQVAMVLEKDPGEDVYASVHRVCPYVQYAPWLRFWEPLESVLPPGPQPLPWDSAAIGRWFAARAAGQGLRPGFQILEGRVFSQTWYGWRLTAGSSVRRSDGFTDTAFVLATGRVVRAVEPEERSPGVIATRRTEETGLNLLALAELGTMLGMRPPAAA